MKDMKRPIIALSIIFSIASSCSNSPEVTWNLDIYEDFKSQFVA